MPREQCDLVVTTDVLVEGVHFAPDTDAEAIGYKALAVNLSDLAAMGAEPAWASLNLSLPNADDAWLSKFSGGFSALAREFGVALIGGDTVSGPLVIGVQLIGYVVAGRALRRDGANIGDRIYITGTLGDAALGLMDRRGGLALADSDRAYVQQRLERPTPRVGCGLAIRGLASAAIDVSDGLVADLGHVLRASGVGARVELSQLPLSAAYRRCNPGWAPALSHGDDYELCFTAPGEHDQAVRRALDDQSVSCAVIGVVDRDPGLRLIATSGAVYGHSATGYQHFTNRTDPGVMC